MGMLDKVNTAIGIKENIKSAIEAKKGSSVTGAFDTYATEIANLPSGIDPSTATATADDVLNGKTFFAGNSQIKTGNISNMLYEESPTEIKLYRGYLNRNMVFEKEIPPVPSASEFTTLNANQQYTATGKGWIRYKIFLNQGVGAYGKLVLANGLEIAITENGEMYDGTAFAEGVYPLQTSNPFMLEVSPPIPSQIANSYLKVYYYE